MKYICQTYFFTFNVFMCFYYMTIIFVLVILLVTLLVITITKLYVLTILLFKRFIILVHKSLLISKFSCLLVLIYINTHEVVILCSLLGRHKTVLNSLFMSYAMFFCIFSDFNVSYIIYNCGNIVFVNGVVNKLIYSLTHVLDLKMRLCEMPLFLTSENGKISGTSLCRYSYKF